MFFKIDPVNFSIHTIPVLTTELIGFFSIDGDLQYHANLSQLKYYNPPPDFNNVNFDLTRNFESTQHKSNLYVKLDNILKWLSNNFSRLERPLSIQEERWLDVDFICRRGVLKTILCSLYTRRNEWIICASKYRGTIYLCEFYTDEREYQHVNRTKTEKEFFSWGYKFEQYMVSDKPSHKPDPSVSLNECEEFHCVFKAKFGDHSLLYGAETDGISSRELITETDFITLFGKTFELIELKTIVAYNSNGDMYENISSEKILMWWSQNYLANVNKIICGLKDRNSVVRRIKEYSMHELPYLSKPFCKVDECKIFCKIFLDKVKEIVTKDHTECMYKFHWKPSAKYIVCCSEVAPDNKTYFFLKQWFLNTAEEHRNHS
ncbi:decapping and exoribonuclease protein [Pogonomyrmex barbatus]|uniref:Decapping nuclease n=1 Tax=Pogonomyrmex barbatus TaxID=144034 RepID=A0A6I9VTY1_9HYME|nr:decapping and exoribonuclease protein [Pogonomyrmex barbatus]